MRRIWVAVALIAICISLALSEFYIVEKNYEHYIDKVNLTSAYFSYKEYKTAELHAENMVKEWQKSSKKLNAFLSHDKTDEINENFSQLVEFINSKDKVMFSSTCEKIKRQLLCLKKSELPNLENIM
ncbi:MAG: DUF4363 family protein [Ruminococcus sp.]|nr:DUF4363 family protein [Ruminococcus sp.]